MVSENSTNAFVEKNSDIKKASTYSTIFAPRTGSRMSKYSNVLHRKSRLAEKTHYNIEAFGTVTITVDTPHGPGTSTLLDGAYAPGFMTNIVCLSKFTDKGIHWDTAKRHLHRQGKTFCYVHKVDQHW